MSPVCMPGYHCIFDWLEGSNFLSEVLLTVYSYRINTRIIKYFNQDEI